MLQLNEIGFSYGHDSFRIADVTLGAHMGTRLAILGRSGSGKSTLIKLLGGHLVPNRGSIFLNDQDITRTEPGGRGVSTVFQDLALFPHLSVYKNVEFPLTIRGKMTHGREREVQDYLKRFGIWERRDSKPRDLSGGERQRTALARSLISNPSLLLLDEPTASLDSQQKTQLATFLDEMLQLESVPLVVIVTHDHEFAFSVCSSLAIIKDGRMIAHGETRRLLANPGNIETAAILDTHSVIHGRVDQRGEFRSEDGAIRFAVARKYTHFKGEECAVLLRSDSVSLTPLPNPGSDYVTAIATTRSVQLRGIYTRALLEVGNQIVICDLFKDSGVIPTRGQVVTFSFPIEEAQLVSGED